eukprot:comp9813_c0_seq1/m.4772 comp9813_c0_seq1/g.4772  ORF comp9813_c0_seq1/g.4772 comp9813_c0_seq1/m.4772 type:complete len:345 (-) comp9813_c0_seq1:340-1374(-)
MFALVINANWQVASICDPDVCVGPAIQSAVGQHLATLIPSLKDEPENLYLSIIRGSTLECTRESSPLAARPFFLSYVADFPHAASGRLIVFQEAKEVAEFQHCNPFGGHMQTTILQVSSIGRIEHAPRCSPTLFGYEASELVGQPIMRFVADEELPQFCRKLDELGRHGIGTFTTRMLRSRTHTSENLPSTTQDGEQELVDVEIWGKTGPHGSIFLVLIEEDLAGLQENGVLQVKQVEEVELESTSKGWLQGYDILTPVVESLRFLVSGVLAARPYIMCVLSFLQCVSGACYSTTGHLAARGINAARLLFKLVQPVLQSKMMAYFVPSCMNAATANVMVSPMTS